LKPANILINCKDCSIKIADFGLSRVVGTEVINGSKMTDHPLLLPQDAAMHKIASDGDDLKEPNILDDDHEEEPHTKETVFIKPSFTRTLTTHVITRWYRSPEVILTLPYSSAVDIWSIGCIFAELLGMIRENAPSKDQRHPIFPGRSCPSLSPSKSRPSIGSNHADQLSTIFKVLGSPTDDELQGLEQETIDHIKTIPTFEAKNPKTLLPALDDDEQDLLLSMLKFHPGQRITVEQALSHKYFTKIRKIESEVSCDNPMDIAIEQIEEDREHLFDSLVKEILADG